MKHEGNLLTDYGRTVMAANVLKAYCREHKCTACEFYDENIKNHCDIGSPYSWGFEKESVSE